jgi:hypothetical protein
MSCKRQMTRAERLRHASECAACRKEQFGSRPDKLFSLLALESPAEDALDRLSAGIMSRIERESAGRRRRLQLRSIFPVAASFVLAGFFGIYTTLQQTGTPLAMAPMEPFLEASAPNDAIELISTPGEAQVMEFNVGETQVVMIFDEAMDI